VSTTRPIFIRSGVPQEHGDLSNWLVITCVRTALAQRGPTFRVSPPQGDGGNLVVRATRNMAGASHHAVGCSQAVVVPSDVSHPALPFCRATALPALTWRTS